MGELRALRWSDLDFAKRLVHVRRSYTGAAFGAPTSQRVRSVPMSDQVARVLDGLSRREGDLRPDDLVLEGGLGIVARPFAESRAPVGPVLADQRTDVRLATVTCRRPSCDRP
jgi:integrase